MKFLPLTTSLIALALFSAPALSQEEVPAQAAVEEAAPQVPEEVLVLLNDTRPLAELSVDELGNRAKQARSSRKWKASRQKPATSCRPWPRPHGVK